MAAFEVAPQHLALETLPFAVIVVRDERVVYVNPAWVQLIGIPREQVVGMGSAEVIGRGIDPDDREWLLLQREQSEARKDVPPQKLWFHVVSPGRHKPLVQMVYWPGVAPGDQAFALMDAEDEARARDLTHQLVQGATALLRYRDEEALLAAALEVLAAQGLGCSVLFSEGDRLRPGPSRLPPELLSDVEVGPPFPRARLPHSRALERTRRAGFRQDLRPWGEAVFAPADFRRAAPHLRDLKGLDAPLFVGDALRGFLCVQSAMLTPAAAASVELYALHVSAALENAQNHQQSAARLEEVQRLQAQIIARERLSVLGEAAAVMAHEMQNPLGAILNAVALLRPRPPEAGAPVLKMIEEEARSLERLAKDLLSWAKPLSADFTFLPVAGLLQEAAAQVSAAETARIRVLPCDARLRIWGDGHLLKLALSNLLRNAVQASPKGGEIRLWAEEGGPAPGIRLVVEDEGQGVPEALRERIFEPFFTSRAQGSGLGLALVSRVIKAHSGQVQVLDAVPRGARFEVLLPAPG